MNEQPFGSGGLQRLLVACYGLLYGDALRRSRLGRWLFEKAYVSYKLLLEARPIDQLVAYIRPGSWVIDVGANIGVFTLKFAASLRAGGHVIALEPEAENFAALNRRVANSRFQAAVVTRRAAAVERSGTVHMKINTLHPGDHRLSSAGQPVPAVTLDALVAEFAAPPVSLVKIDVQGAEMRVLLGAEALLVRDRPTLFIEIDDGALRAQGSSATEVLCWLRERGYAPFRLHADGRTARLSGDDVASAPAYIDVLFLPADASSSRGSVDPGNPRRPQSHMPGMPLSDLFLAG